MINSDVRAAFPEFTQRFEGRKSWMYADVKGLITTGVGNLIDPIALALVLPWRDDAGDLAPASQVEDNWNTVKAMPHGLRYAAESFQLHEGVHLAEDDINRLVLMRADEDASFLVKHWFPMLADYPKGTQTAVLSMAWALGAGWPGKFPKCTAAILRQDWENAAVECVIPELGMDPKGRNAANQACFRGFVVGSDDE